MSITITLGEEDRQLVLCALGRLSCERHGWDGTLNRIACLMDNVQDGRAVTYDQHRKLERTTGWHRVQDNADE